MSEYEFKGTPGPWEICNYGDVFSRLGGDSGDGVKCDDTDGWQVAEVGLYEAFVEGQLVEIGESMRKANLQAISAVPELIEALDQSLTALLDSGYAPDSVVVIAARSALAKATGERTGGES